MEDRAGVTKTKKGKGSTNHLPTVPLHTNRKETVRKSLLLDNWAATRCLQQQLSNMEQNLKYMHQTQKLLHKSQILTETKQRQTNQKGLSIQFKQGENNNFPKTEQEDKEGSQMEN